MQKPPKGSKSPQRLYNQYLPQSSFHGFFLKVGYLSEIRKCYIVAPLSLWLKKR